MGQTQSKSSVCGTEFLHQLQSDGSIGYCELVSDKRTGQQFERYKLIQQNMDIQEQIRFYEYRKSQDANLVRVLCVEDVQSIGFCNAKKCYNIYCQRIPLRLSDISNIAFQEGLMVIKHVLEALDAISNTFDGILKVNSEMIGFTVDGKVKTWINQSFHLNHPEQHMIIKGANYDNNPGYTALEVFQVVQKHIKDKVFPISFSTELSNSRANFSFQKAKTLIRNYCIQHNIILPETLNFSDYISKSKKQSLKLERVSSTFNKKVPTRAIKIIPEVMRISQNLATPNALAEQDSNSGNINNWHSKSNRQNKIKMSENSLGAELSYDEAVNLNSKQIERIKSQYILESLVVHKANMEPLSWELQNSRGSTESAEQNQQALMKGCRQTVSLSERIDKLSQNVRLEIEKSLFQLNLNLQGKSLRG